jgi:hypothetical protein
MCLLLVLLIQLPGTLLADDQATIAAIRKVGGTVRALEEGWEVEFHLSGRNLRDDQLVHVARLKGVTSLNLKRTKISSAGLVHLKEMTSLQLLHLELTAVTDQGMQHLAGLKDLKYLNLYGTEITDQTLVQLVGLKSLQRLYVWQTGVTDEGVAKLKKQLPALQVMRGVDFSKIAAEFPPEKPATLPTVSLKLIETSNAADAPRSTGGDNIEVVFQNKSARAVKLVWVGYDGKLKLYGELQPGAMRVQNSYANNCWLITDKADESIGYFICGSERALAVIAD